MSKRSGTSFMASEVVDLYQHRPPYPNTLYAQLRRLAPIDGRVLDLGSGPGKIARVLAQSFQHVTAVDPSAAMIAKGRALDGGDQPNLDWVESCAEDVPLTGTYDLVVAALSIHWMDHPRLFDRLVAHLNPCHVLAVVEGDAPHDPPWHGDWQVFMTKWVPLMTGTPFNPDPQPEFWTRYQRHVDISDTFTLISEPVRQSIDDFILCQHSRDTFAISKLGARRAAFDAELRELLMPFASADGQLSFSTITTLTTAKIPLSK